MEDSSPTPVFLQGLPLCKIPRLAVGWELALRSSGMSWVDGDGGVGTRDVRYPRGA